MTAAGKGLQISLLGPFLVTREGRPVTAFATDAARALLAYLALQAGTPCRREALAGLLWPDQPDAAALQNLRQTLSRLRHALGNPDAAPPYLLATHDTIGLNAEAPCWVDVAAFDRALAACKIHLHRHLETCPACIERLREVVALYRGELLSGFSLPSAPFEEWLRGERERRRLEVLEGLYALAAYHERRGEREQALRDARRLLALEPWHEGAHRQVMRALVGSGQRAAALAQYEACRQALVEELGVEPEIETARLYEDIRDHPEGGSLKAPQVPGTRLLHNLPAQTTPFVGRQRELDLLGGWLQEPGCRLVSLVGPGGSGKTRLALEVAAEQAYAFGHGAAFVTLAAVGTAEGMVPAVAQALELALQPGEDPRRQLLAYLRDKELLLVLDNVEHLLPGLEEDGGDGAALLADLLRAAPGLTIVATSRARLELQAERVFPVSGMDYPTPDLAGFPTDSHRQPVRSVLDYSAVQLYLHTARRVRPGYEPAVEDLGAVARLCRLVEGMPLALILAAAWSDALSPAQITDRVAQGLGALEAGWRDLPERQRSVRATFDASWRLLGEEEREAFAALSVFRGGFTLQAAEEVAGITLGTLRALAHKSFLQVEAEGRYSVHELLRQYGAEQLARTPEQEWAARERHCAYFMAALARWAEAVKGPRYGEVGAELAVEIGNAWAAWEWAVAQGQEERLAQGLDALQWFCNSYGRYQEGIAAFEAAAARLGEVGRGSARLLLRLATAQLALVQDAESWQRLFERCQDLLACPDLAGQDVRREEAAFCMQMATPTVWVLPHGVPEAYAERALALYQELGDRRGIATVHGVLGFYALVSSDHEEARRQLAQQFELSRSLGHLEGVLGTIFWLGMVAFSQGLSEECDGWAREWSAHLGGYVERDAGTLWMSGQAHLLSGRYGEADAALEECAAIYRRAGGTVYLGRMLYLLGLAQLHLGQYDRAGASAQEGVTLARENRSHWPEAGAFAVLGSVALVEGRPEAALELLDRAATLYRREPNRSWSGEALAYAGYAARRLGREAEARQRLAEALRLGLEVRSLLPLWAALPAVALLAADRGEMERAAELYALAWSVPAVAQSRWYEDVAGRELAAVAAGLPPEAREAASARGRAREIWATAGELLAGLRQGESRL